MDIELIKRPFKKIGAEVERLELGEMKWRGVSPANYRIDVKHGVFQIFALSEVEVSVVDVKAEQKHLLLNITDMNARHVKSKHKFLLGFDERDWFVAAVPEKFTWVKNVEEAKAALKPDEVVRAEKVLKKKSKNVRKNKAWIRQGEWFFIPAYELVVDKRSIHRNEPISRGNGGKPHMVDEVYRELGEVVYVSKEFPAGVSQDRFKEIVRIRPHMRSKFRMMMRNSEVYAKGRVKHADHATIFLDGWHKVMMNTESAASSMASLAFLD